MENALWKIRGNSPTNELGCMWRHSDTECRLSDADCKYVLCERMTYVHTCVYARATTILLIMTDQTALMSSTSGNALLQSFSVICGSGCTVQVNNSFFFRTFENCSACEFIKSAVLGVLFLNFLWINSTFLDNNAAFFLLKILLIRFLFIRRKVYAAFPVFH